MDPEVAEHAAIVAAKRGACVGVSPTMCLSLICKAGCLARDMRNVTPEMRRCRRPHANGQMQGPHLRA